MKVVVTGATGFIGRPLVRSLVAAGHEVVAWSREGERARRLLPAACAVVTWDVRSTPDASMLEGVDAIIHLAGEPVAGPRWTAARQRAIRDSRVDSTRRIVAACASLPEERRPKTLVSASAIGFYGDRGDERLDESSRPGEGFLASVCREWEERASAAADLGIRTAILRVGIVLGRDGGALAAMLPPFRAGLGGRVGAGRQWMSWIHLEDVVAMFHAALEDERWRGPVNAVAPEPVTNGSFTTTLADVLDRPAIVPVPALGLRLALGEMATIVLASQRVLPRAAERLGFRFRHRDLSPAIADLCHDPEHVLEREQWVPRPIEEVFEFFSDARNLERITPEFLRFRVLDVDPPAMGRGTRIRYRLSLHGVPMWWRTLIEEWEPGRRFVDVQESGPYALWHHTHEFEPRAGGTLVRDRVRYVLPAGGVGELVAGSFVARDVERIFDHRHRAIEEIFGTSRDDSSRARAA